MLFGKNSDRQRNEAQCVLLIPGAEHAADAQFEATHICIPQVRRTHAVLLSQPFWIRGAEMGANEHGLVIGNEGLQARSSAPEQPALTGMDLLRLALERASTASAAVEVITSLLERHGQGGNCGHLAPSYYHNSFMIADPREAFVLETVDREWMLEKVAGVRTISNKYSIGSRVERTSAGLRQLIRSSGWSDAAEPNHGEAIASPDREHIGNAGRRQGHSMALLMSRSGALDVADMMRVLRDHGSNDCFHPQWRAECATTRTVCMHAGADDRPGQTVGSWVSELHADGCVHWVTATSAPCISIFKPVIFGLPLPSAGARPNDRFDARTLWWRHERLHRRALAGEFAGFLEEIRPERDALEAQFQQRTRELLRGGADAERSRIIEQCWREAGEMEDRWAARLAPPRRQRDTAFDSGWKAMNRLAGLEIPPAPGSNE